MKARRLSIVNVAPQSGLLGLSGTIVEGEVRYRVFVSLEALREFGAGDDTASWLQILHANEEIISARASEFHRRTPLGPALVTRLNVPT